VTRIILDPPMVNKRGAPAQAIISQAAVDMLPPWAARMHGIRRSPLFARPAVDAATYGLARTLRWAFAGEVAR
jgi:hypothetical protein